jgi:predicted Zn-dependent peptidase
VDISLEMERVGGEMNASTDHETMVLWVKVARPHFRLAFDLLTDMLRHALLDQKETEKERLVVLEELGMTNDNPDEKAMLLADEVLFPGHPLGRDVGGTPDTVRGLTREMLAAYLKDQYSPVNTVVSVAGDVAHDEVVALARETLEDWEPIAPRSFLPASFAQAGPAINSLNRKTEQAHIVIGAPGLPALHPDRYALDLLVTALGEGMSSRLFLELREKQGLVYDVNASAHHYQDTGSVVVYAGTDPRRAARTARGVLTELKRIQKGVTQDELRRAQEVMKGRMMLRMEDSRAVAGWMGSQELLRGHMLTVDDVAAHLDAVTADDLVRVAKDLFKPEGFRLGLVGPFRSDIRFRSMFGLKKA